MDVVFFLCRILKMKKASFTKQIILFGIFFLGVFSSHAQKNFVDSTQVDYQFKHTSFYDSLEYRAGKNKVTGWLYDMLVSSPAPQLDEKTIALNYFKSFEGMLIEKIEIKPLDVFGPTLTDTTKTSDKWIDRAANKIHNNSNLNTIRKQLLFEIGDAIDPELFAENERIIRQIPYLRDVRFIIERDSVYSAFAIVTVLTKDRFSWGVSGGVSGIKAGDIAIYNKNVLGIGHEISLRFVGHLDKDPKLGVETFYRINNLGGHFMNIDMGYLNTYQREGVLFNLQKPFISNEIKWGYGLIASRLFRTSKITEDHPIELDDPISVSYNNIWVGHSFDLKRMGGLTRQLTPATGIHNLYFFDVNKIPEGSEHFFSNRTLYLAGLTWSQRMYVQDKLIYSYGIIEDIPIGFKQEMYYGYDANQFGDRHFLQLFSSNGLLLPHRGYLYFSTGINGYFKNHVFEEGLVRADVNFFSGIRTSGNKMVRSFIKMNYTLGLKRYPFEYLTIGGENYIRGFRSNNATGQQRLTLNMEHVIFLPREIYGFKMAFFGFADLGIIGQNKQLIFKEDYYAGLGLGIRLHNENLVFNTFQLRLAFYPFHPDDMSVAGFIFDEQSKTRFNSLEPTAPQPIPFQ